MENIKSYVVNKKNEETIHNVIIVPQSFPDYNKEIITS